MKEYNTLIFKNKYFRFRTNILSPYSYTIHCHVIFAKLKQVHWYKIYGGCNGAAVSPHP